MPYATIALAVLGFVVGVIFRLKVLLPILGLLFLVSLVLSLVQGLNFADTALSIMLVQTTVQGSYFLGLVARSIFAAKREEMIL